MKLAPPGPAVKTTCSLRVVAPWGRVNDKVVGDAVIEAGGCTVNETLTTWVAVAPETAMLSWPLYALAVRPAGLAVTVIVLDSSAFRLLLLG